MARNRLSMRSSFQTCGAWRRRISDWAEVGVRAAQLPKPKYVVVNADEGNQPPAKTGPDGERPHQLLEGMLIAGLAVARAPGTSTSAANTAT